MSTQNLRERQFDVQKLRVEKILVATDFSSCADGALDLAITYAKHFGARITLVHAYGLPIYPMGDGAIIPPPQTVVELVQGVSTALDKAKARVVARGVEIDTRAVQGPAHDAIVDIAVQDGFDLVVIGTHGRTGLHRLVLGSVAEHVVRFSPVPVLTVRSGRP